MVYISKLLLNALPLSLHYQQAEHSSLTRQVFGGPVRAKLSEMRFPVTGGSGKGYHPLVFLSSTWMQPAISLVAFLSSVADFDVVQGCPFHKMSISNC